MTYSIAANAGDNQLMTYHLVRIGFLVKHTIESILETTPIQITITNHGLSTGDLVTIDGVTESTPGNTTGAWAITKTGANTFTLDGSTGSGTATGGYVYSTSYQYWTDADIPLVFDGHRFTPQGITVSSFSSSETGLGNGSIEIQNADYTMAGFIYNPLSIKGIPVDIWEAWLDPVNTKASLVGVGTDVKYLFSGRVDSGVLTRNGDISVATYQLRPLINTNAQLFPRDKYTANCSVIFKGVACQYAGTDATCTRTLADCTSKGNQLHFRGFPFPGLFVPKV